MRVVLRKFAIVVVIIWAISGAPTISLAASCSNPANSIQAENCLPGAPQNEWDVTPDSDGVPRIGDLTIQGFATDISVNVGSTISFKVSTDAAAYRLDIYRMGYYGGNGARLVASIQPSAQLPQTQPACLTDSTTGLIDCGNWAVSATWTVPANGVSGIYFAHLVRADTGGSSHIVFIVRNDSSHSDLLMRTADATWQAYNFYGGKSLYGCGDGDYDESCRAYKVSYNRPFYTRGNNTNTWVFAAEYPMVRWLESNGYDVSYISEVDVDRTGSLLLNHKTFLTAGHGEYWSGNERSNVEAARSAGVNLAFFSGDELFEKTRYENSIDGSNTSYRTLVCYKETFNNAPLDPDDPPIWTGTWRDARFSPPADGGRPENALLGMSTESSGPVYYPITVTYEDGQMRFWRNTAIAALLPGASYTTPNGTLGYEWDIDNDNGFRPAGLFHLSTSVITTDPYLCLDPYGETFGPGITTHNMTLYRYTSKSLVFDTGTVQWSWGLDANHDRGAAPASASVPQTDVNMQQATVNLLADMGAQPVSLQPGLVLATKSTDTSPPASIINAPVNAATLAFGTPITISGTATDVGGTVGGVEISLDGGNTWHPASGRSTWSFLWSPAAEGNYTIRSRAVDDSGNLESPQPGVSVTVLAQAPPPAPSAPMATAGNASVTLSWSRVTTAVTYNIKRATVSGGPYTTIATGVTPIVYLDNSLVNGRTYYYVISASNSQGESPNSAEVSAQPQQPIASCPACLTLWLPNAVPVNPDTGISQGAELGVYFQTQSQGNVAGVRFYKSISNTGTHIGNLWTPQGVLLASTTFTNETSSGWQIAWFSNPVPITANSNYIASYFAPNGHYAQDLNYFATAGVNNLPLFAPVSAAVGGNGVGVFSSSSTFPASTYESSNYWVDVIFEPGQVPAAPTGLTASAGNSEVTLSWNAAAGATSYNVKRSTTNGGAYTKIATGVTATTYTDSTVADGTTYYYVISAVNGFGESPNSAQVTAEPTSVPGAPTGLTATPGNSEVSLSWNAVPTATSYNVKRSTANGGPYSVIAKHVTSTSYTNTGLTNGRTYYFVVSAVNANGESPNSAQVSAVPSCRQDRRGCGGGR